MSIAALCHQIMHWKSDPKPSSRVKDPASAAIDQVIADMAGKHTVREIAEKTGLSTYAVRGRAHNLGIYVTAKKGV